METVNKRTHYSNEFKSEVMLLYIYSSYSCIDISKMFNLTEGTAYRWCGHLKRVFEKPDFNTGILLEEIIGAKNFTESGRWTITEAQTALDKYYGVNEGDFFGLKSRV